ncbi:MAG: hypothetical protein DELT_02782 [Desulfovibrio sp.]
MNQTASSVSFLAVPIDGVAAYWLSLKKLQGNSRNMRSLEAESQFVAEPFIRHLLDMLIAQLPAARIQQLAEICRKNEMDRMDRQFDLIRIAVLDAATGENPLRTLARITARYPFPAADPQGMLDTAQNHVAAVSSGALSLDAYTINHRLSDETLTTALLFYTTLSRRHGKAACRTFLPQEGSVFFTDALSLVVDGFDAPFIRKWMKRYKMTVLADINRKIALSTDMCAAMAERIPFEEMRFLVRSYIR